MPTHKAYTFASRTSPDTNQSLQKSMLFPTLRKNKKSTPLKKNKTLPTLNPTDRKGMKETFDKQNGMSLEKKEGQLVTCGIFYCRVNAEINVCGSLQTSLWFDSDVLRSRQQKHTAIRYKQAEKKDNDTMTIKILLHKDKERNGKASPQKQECGCPSLHPSLRSHTHAFFLPTLQTSLIKVKATTLIEPLTINYFYYESRN